MNRHQREAVLETRLKAHDARTRGERLADCVASGMGSWKFIIIQTIIVIIWMASNIVGFVRHWDTYPFILLNLLFSTQAAYAAPIIMMSQNRAAQRDREMAKADDKLLREDHMIITKIDQEMRMQTQILTLLQDHIAGESDAIRGEEHQ